MSWKIRHKLKGLHEAETDLHGTGTGRGGALSVCVVYPNEYRTGMGSLGFQTVWRLFAEADGIRSERAFLPSRDDSAEHRRSRTPLLSLESQTPLAQFDVIAFSISFEPDYLNIPVILNLAGIPLLAAGRSQSDPLILAGGAALFINPEPVADFLDIICVGEGEEIVPGLVAALLSPRRDETRQGLYSDLARLPGFYIPAQYRYRADGPEAGHTAAAGYPLPVVRATPVLADHPPAATCILADQTEFGDMFLIEVSRGCPRGCRFCSSGFIYGAYRQQQYDHLLPLIDIGLKHRGRIGLVGAAVSDHAGIGRLCRHIVAQGGKVSVSSLRVDRIDSDMLDALIASGHRTISLAPEGGSQRLRDLIRKNLTEEQILETCELLISRDILNLKLYFIIGLPTETGDDLEELIRLVTGIRERVIERARGNRRLGEITLSVNPFIPKPFTPFQWCGMEPLPSLEKKVRLLESRFRPLSNLRLKVESLRESYLQALLSRGDRRLTPLITAMAEGTGIKAAARQHGVDTDWFVHRQIGGDEMLPWGIIGTSDHIRLRAEYEKALQGREEG